MAKSKGFLLDTQVFIWWMERNKRLSQNIVNLLASPANRILLSVVSVWEIIIKKEKKKLKISQNIKIGIESSGFTLLPIEISHVLEIAKLPGIHKDPFDRMLIAQVKVENLTFITTDQKIWRYNIPLFKA